MATQFCEELHWDLVSKKVDLVESQLRKIEKDHEKVINILRGEVDLKEKANEFQKEISKQQKQLKQDIINLSGRLDDLQSSESRIKALASQQLHARPAENHFGVTAKDVEEMVQQRVQQEVSRAMEVALQTFAKEHANHKAVSHHYNNSYTSLKKEHHSTEELAKIKNEQYKLVGEIERLKNRQTYVEGVCKDLSPSAVKNIDATEQCKKDLVSLRKECDDLFHALSNSFSEMNMTLLTNKSQTSQLHTVVTALEAHAKHTEQVLSQFDSKLTTFNQFKQESTEVVNKVHEQSEYLYAKVTIVENTLETHRVTIVGEVEKRLKGCELSCRQDLEGSLREITNDFNNSMSTMTDAFNQQHKKTLDAVEKVHSELAASLADRLDATEGQLKDLDLNADNLVKMKAAIDSVLSEIDQRAQSDASWSYNFNSLLQKCEIRLKALEEVVPLCEKNEQELDTLQAAVEEQGKRLADATAKSDGLFKDLATTLHHFKEDIHTSLLNADEQNVQQFMSVDDMIVKIVNDIPVLIEQAQSDTVDICLDRQTEEVNQLVEKAKQELYDTLMVAVEAPLKETSDALSHLIKDTAESLIGKFDARLQTNVKQAMSQYQAQLNPLLEVEDRLVSRLDESMEEMRGNTENAMRMIAAHLRKVEGSVVHLQQTSRLDDSRVSTSSPSKRDSSTSTVSYPSISVHSSTDGGGHSSGSDAGRVVHPTSTLPLSKAVSARSPASDDSTPLKAVSQLVYQSPSKTRSTPTSTATAAASPMFGDLSELGARIPTSATSAASHHHKAGAPTHSPQGYFIANESSFDVSNYSSNTSSIQIPSTSSFIDVSSASPAAALSGTRLPPKISVKSPPKSGMVFLTSTHYGNGGAGGNPIEAPSPFSVSSILSHKDDPPAAFEGEGFSRAVHPIAIVSAAATSPRQNSSQSIRSPKASLASPVGAVKVRSEAVQTTSSPTSDSMDSPSDTEDSRSSNSTANTTPSTTPVSHVLHESFADFNHIIDTVNTDIRALDLHLHDLVEGVAATGTTRASATAPTAVLNTISPIKVNKRYPQEEEVFSDSTSEADDDVLRASFERSVAFHNGKEDLDLTAVEHAAIKESEKRRAMFELYQKKLNHRKNFQRNITGM